MLRGFIIVYFMYLHVAVAMQEINPNNTSLLVMCSDSPGNDYLFYIKQ